MTWGQPHSRDGCHQAPAVSGAFGTVRGMTTPAAAPVASSTGSDFARLSRRMNEAGLLSRRPGYYARPDRAARRVLRRRLAAFVALGDSWWQLLVAVLLAVVFGQIALVSHDLAHRQVFRTRRPTEIAGLIAGNLGIGMSYGWWMDKHTRHHANPNHEELDPDVAPDVLVWSPSQARASRGIPRFLGRWQAYLFFPLLTLEGLNLHVSGVRALREPDPQAARPGGDRCCSRTSPPTWRRCSWCCRPGKAVAVPRRAPGAVGHLPGLDLRAQPQGHAHAHRQGPPRLPPPPGAHLAQRARRLRSSTRCSAA